MPSQEGLNKSVVKVESEQILLNGHKTGQGGLA